MSYSEIAVETDHRVKTIMQHEPLLKSIRDYLRVNLLEEHSIEQICARFTITEYALQLGFRMLFGNSVHSYLQRLRLAHAWKELTETERSIKDIANETGYKHVHHFNAAFRKRFGMTPTRLREDEVESRY